MGGHCIGVDPYYLTYKAQMLDCQPDIILAGRKTNDGMSRFIAEQIILEMIRLDMPIRQAKIAVLGLTFKENCNDVRNTKVADLIHNLSSYGANIVVHDPIADAEEVKKHYDIALSPWSEINALDVVIFAVKHDSYLQLDYAEMAKLLKPKALLADIKNTIDIEKLKQHHNDITLWRL